MADNQNDIEKALESLKPKQKQMLDVLYSSNDMITKIHGLRKLLMDSISSPAYLAGLSPEDWSRVMDSLTEAEKVTGSFINDQARIAEKAPQAVQNVFAVLAGQANVQQVTTQQKEPTETYQIPTDILPIQQALQTSLDRKFNIDRTAAIKEYEGTENIVDVESTQDEGNTDTSI